MKNKTQILSCVLILLLYMTGCEKVQYNPAANLPAIVSFSKNIVPILNSNCVSCHDSSGSSAMTAPVLSGKDAYQNLLESADTISSKTSDLYLMVTAKAINPMPPSSGLSDNDSGMILKWMEQGTKNN
jgi:uncharacterized membrane protein